MLFTTQKATLALLCLAGYSSAFALPAVFQREQENTWCAKIEEGSPCSPTEDYGLYACSLDHYDIVSRQTL